MLLICSHFFLSDHKCWLRITASFTAVKLINLKTPQGRELNGNGELYLQKHQRLNVKIIDGSSLAAAVALKSIPSGTKQVVIAGTLSKVGCAIATELCKKGIQVLKFSLLITSSILEVLVTDFYWSVDGRFRWHTSLIFIIWSQDFWTRPENT